MELSRKKEANGTPKERKEFRGTFTELPSVRPSPAKVPNYLPKILAAKLKPGLTHAYVFHDEWCAVFKGGPCNCNPEIEMRGEGDATH